MGSWGYWDVVPTRPTTVRHERLTVFEPGLPASVRYALRALRNAGIASGLLGVLSAIAFGVPVALVVTAGFIAVCAVVARRLRGHSRSLFATVRIGTPTAESELMDDLRERLTRLENDRRNGLLSPVDWEAACWSVYELLGEWGRVARRG
jgi:hypothetical protein